MILSFGRLGELNDTGTNQFIEAHYQNSTSILKYLPVAPCLIGRTPQNGTVKVYSPTLCL